VDLLLVAGLLLAGALALTYFVFASFVYGAGYQPTPRRSVEAMLRLAEVGPTDTVYDLGAGTGAIVFRAARIHRARVVGAEVEPIRVLILRLRRRTGPFADRITIYWGDFFHLNFRDATVVSAFLWPGAMARLRPRLEAELPPGARVVSHCHPVVGWTPEVYDPETDVYFYRRPPTAAPDRPTTRITGGT
jgi:hypothetical protein